MKSQMIKKYKKVVVKIGSNSIVDSKTKKIKFKWLDNLCKDIAELNKTKKIVIVCSGAIALGAKSISNTKLRKLEDKQAAASVGQIELAHQWRNKLGKYKIGVSQILLTLEDSEERRRYLNARNTISSLQSKNIIPIINENDTVATEEIRYGDNDRLAARVAQMIEADLLILLSDIDGLYQGNPKKDKDIKKISEVFKIDKKIEELGNYQSSAR
jgi:glutamate 5-kinase